MRRKNNYGSPRRIFPLPPSYLVYQERTEGRRLEKPVSRNLPKFDVDPPTFAFHCTSNPEVETSSIGAHGQESFDPARYPRSPKCAGAGFSCNAPAGGGLVNPGFD